MKLKKFIGSLLVMTILLSHLTAAYAGASGEYYYTDIKTYLYHAPITSYNIGGKTVIDAEALNWHYGFDVYWRPQTRKLELTDKGGMFNSLEAMNGGLVPAGQSNLRAVAGRYYKTDIIATLNGREIESYNIGGRTCITAEAMREFGYDVIWDGEKRTLTITKPMDFYSIETEYGTIKTRNNYECQMEFLEELSFGTAGGPPVLSGYARPDGAGYVKLSDVESALDAACTLQETEASAHTEWVGGVSYDDPYYRYRFDFTYDKGQSPELTRFPGAKETPAGKCYQIDDAELGINGETGDFAAMMGGKEYNGGILIIDKIVYIPAYTAEKLLGASFVQ